MTSPARGLTDIAEALRAAKDLGGKCTLLIGAGCSLSAGIPLAADIVSDIRKRHPAAHARAAKARTSPGLPGYGECMRELSPGQRRDLLKGYIDKASINWGHIGLAQLVKFGYVDRILTTNFDPLITRACALVNEFPAVYDLTASTILRPADLPDRAVFHLHGQRNGFVLLNESVELENHAQQLKPVFDHARDGRVWIVVGYSGENDPLFRLIGEVERYEYDLFWIARKAQPAPALADFFSHDRRCFHVHYPKGADFFFMALAHALEAWPPVFLDNPFAHVREQLAAIVEEGEDGTGQGIDWLRQARKKIDAAENAIAGQPSDDISAAQAAYLEGSSDEAAEMSLDSETKANLLNLMGMDLDDQAQALTDSDLPSAIALWTKAKGLYALALELNPMEYWAANNLGNALASEAQAISLNDPYAARILWHEAKERFRQALNIQPDIPDAAFNCAITISEEAQTIVAHDLPAARALWREASEYFQQALTLKPDMYEVASDWGLALADEAQALAASDLPASLVLWKKAGELFQQALTIKPDMYETASDWGFALADEARALAASEPATAHDLWRQARERYRLALDIKPDMHEAADNWGIALLMEFHHTVEAERPALLEQAEQILLREEEIKPGAGAYNLACVHALRDETAACVEWLRASRAANNLDVALMAQDRDLEGVRGTPEYLAFLEELGETATAENAVSV